MTALLPLVVVSVLGLGLAGVGSHIGSVLVTSFGLLSVGLVVVAVGITRIAGAVDGRQGGVNGVGK